MLEEFRLDNGYIWPMAVGPPDLVRLLNVNTQSTAIGIGTDGVVRFRKGYGTNSPTPGAGSWTRPPSKTVYPRSR